MSADNHDAVGRFRGLPRPLLDEEGKLALRSPSLLQGIARSAGGAIPGSPFQGARGTALLLLLALAATAADGALYRWVDEKGRVQYSDTPPQKDRGAVQLSNRGIVLKKLDGALTPEQQKAKDAEEARRKAEDARAAEQRRQDGALLQSFTTVQEIDMKRDREIQALEISIANLRELERGIAARLATDRKRLEAAGQAKKPPPESLKEDIVRSEAERKTLEDDIRRRYDEIAATREKYDALKKRYIVLRQEAQLIQPVSDNPPAALGKK